MAPVKVHILLFVILFVIICLFIIYLFQGVQENPDVAESPIVDQGEVTPEFESQVNQEDSTSRRNLFAKPTKKKNRHTDSEEKRRADEAYNVLQNCRKKDEFSTYGEHVGNEIRKLNEKAQIYVKHAINNILFKAAIGLYDRSNNACESSSPSIADQSSTPQFSPNSSATTTVQEVNEFLIFHEDINSETNAVL